MLLFELFFDFFGLVESRSGIIVKALLGVYGSKGSSCLLTSILGLGETVDTSNFPFWFKSWARRFFICYFRLSTSCLMAFFTPKSTRLSISPDSRARSNFGMKSSPRETAFFASRASSSSYSSGVKLRLFIFCLFKVILRSRSWGIIFVTVYEVNLFFLVINYNNFKRYFIHISLWGFGVLGFWGFCP